MSSRRDEKDRRRLERLEAEAAASAAARRRKLFAGLGMAVLTGIIVVVALVVVSQSGDGGEVTSPAASPLDRLPQSGVFLGEPEAKVTVVEFADLQCPACAEFSRSVVPQLVSSLVEPGEARLKFRNFVILGPESEAAAKASLAAAEQGRYWQFIEAFYANQGLENSGYVTDGFLRDVAATAGIEDLDAWEQDRGRPAWDAQLEQIRRDAVALGFQGTPSVLVEGPGGSEPLGSVGAAEILAAVERVR